MPHLYMWKHVRHYPKQEVVHSPKSYNWINIYENSAV